MTSPTEEDLVHLVRSGMSDLQDRIADLERRLGVPPSGSEVEPKLWTLTRISWRRWRFVRTEDGVVTDTIEIGLVTYLRMRWAMRRNFPRARVLRGGR